MYSKREQPYFHESKYTLFNGELYNENEIRNEAIKINEKIDVFFFFLRVVFLFC
jgi:asparagine synthetase B (glutamine-hydrolysing)